MPRKKRYASTTAVSIGRSREEIQRLLQGWSCKQISWADDFEEGLSILRFVWPHGAGEFMARFDLRLPSEAEMREDAVDGRNGKFSEAKYRQTRDRRGMIEHRELALFLKATFVAVESGIIKAEQVFLPFLEGADGVTVADALIPHLAKLSQFSATRLLPGRR